VPGFGSKLMLKRLALGFSLRDAAKMSGLKQKQLRALEDEDLLRFRDKDHISEMLITYAAVLDLNKAEILKELELIWSDSSTAKNYMQQKYNKSKEGKRFGDNPLVFYSIAVGAAALLLSVGGYFYWNNFVGGQSPVQNQYSVTAGDTQESASADAQTPLDDAEERSGSAEQAEQSTGAVLQDENAVDTNTNDAVSDAPETTDFAEPAAVGEGSADLPRASGTRYLLWVGMLTFFTGLLLFGIPAAANGRNTVAEIGLFT
jgi:cytoskeletal protein RodZ